MKKIFSSVTTILIFAASYSQSSYSYEIINNENVRKQLGPITSDNSGNTIITGQWENTITFGGLTLTNPTPHYGSYNSVFIAKMLANESFSWVNAIYPQEIPNDVSRAWVYGANTDAAGNIYLTGYFFGKCKFGNSILSSTKNGNVYTNDIFLTKISPSGAFLWSTKEGSAYSCGEEGRSVCTDNSENVYITGKITQKVFKNVDTCSPCVPAIYVAKYNVSGARQWQKLFYNSQASGNVCGESNHGTDIRCNGSDVYVKADMYGSVNFGTVTLNTGSNTTSNVVLLKLDANGNTVFAKSVTGSKNFGYTAGDGLFVDNNGDAYIRGIFYANTISFGGCSLAYASLPAWLAKFSSSGNCLWAITPGGISYGVVPHPDGNLAILLRRTGSPYPAGGWYGIKELSPLNGSAVDSTEVALADTATASIWGYPSIARLPDGFIFSEHIQGTLHFGNLTITSTGTADNMMLIKYTATLPPVARPGNIAKEVSSSEIIHYPNPTSTQLTILNNNNKILGTLVIYDASGKMIYKKFVGNSQATIDVKNFSAGFYYIRSDQLQATIKFIKQ